MGLGKSLFNILILLTLLANQGSARPSGPTLNVPSEWVVYSSEASVVPLEITCTGQKPLVWETEVNKKFYNVSEKHIASKFSSTFIIADPFPADSGNFTCRYGSGESVTTYVYVYDNQTGFVNQIVHDTIYVTIGEKIRLDCRTTHPGITVKVYKNNVEDVTDRFERDHFYIFEKKAKSLQETGIYSCKANEHKNENSWFVSIKPTVTLHEPSIEEFSNSHHVVGFDFQLNCSIPVSESDNPTFDWEVPNPEKKIQTVLKEQKPSGLYAISALTVMRPTLSDSGNYTCVVKQGANKKSVSEGIKIQESIRPFVKIDETSKHQNILSVNEKDPFQWILYFKGFPDNIKYTFFDPFNRTLSDNMTQVSTDFSYNEGKVSLRINNIGAEHFGLYSVSLSTDGIVDNTSVVTIVNATPKIEFQFVPKVFPVAKPISLNSSILSFDWEQSEPNVTWWFNDNCPNGIGSCAPSSKGNHLLPGKILKPKGPINRFISPLTFEVSHSGRLESIIENKFGVNSTSAHIILSDIGDVFTFNITTSDVSAASKTQITVKDSRSINIVEGDDVELLCAALNFVYEALNLETTGSLVPVNCSSPLSNAQCINGSDATVQLQGTYRCSARNKVTGKTEFTLLDIKVLEKEPPSLLPGSNVSLAGASVTVKSFKPFNISCFVKGTPTPRITWFKDGENVEETMFSDSSEETIFLRQNRQILEFKFAQKEMQGKYTCQAENRAGLIEPYVAVQVERAGLSGIQWTLIVLAILCITVLCSVVAFLVHRVKKERRLRKELRQNHRFLFEKGNIGNINPDCTVDEQADLLPYDYRYEVPKEKIKFGKLLGSGAFGRVMEARVEDLDEDGKWTRVAVKMCKDGTDASQLHALTLELKIMIHLGRHLNIVNLMGANTVHLDKGDLWILVEYCKYGNLLKFLQKHKSRFVNQIDPETGLIDPNRMSPLPQDIRSPLSPTRTSYGGTVFLPTDADGYLESRSKFGSIKSGQPYGRHPSVSSNADSVTGMSSRPGLYAGNPHYVTVAFSRQSSQGSTKQTNATATPNGGSAPNYVTAAQFAPSMSPSSKHSCSDSTVCTDEGYHKTLATDMTVITSPSPRSPSSEAGDFSFDGQTGIEPMALIPGVDCPFTTCDLICWSWQVANGMEYLAQRKVLHGDLAARNLLLAQNNVIKISDFGLSRDMYKNDIYMKKGDDNMPIKWMSPEAIQQKIFSTQSDVWAFGITMWELFTLGNTPYPGIPLDPNFTLLLENGMRMEKPKYATSDTYDLMLNCWSAEPTDRPTFNLISDILAEMISPESRECYIAMNNVHMDRNAEWMASREDYFNLMSSPTFENFQPSAEHMDDILYIPMDGIKAMIEADEKLNPPSGYLDMRSVRSSSPPPSAAVFSPRPNQPPLNIFSFTESSESHPITKDQTSPAETSKLLDRVEEPSEAPTPGNVETDKLLRGPPLTPTSDQMATNNNQVDSLSLEPEYKNIEVVSEKSKNKVIDDPQQIIHNEDDCAVNYVNIPNMPKGKLIILPNANDSSDTYVNTAVV